MMMMMIRRRGNGLSALDCAAHESTERVSVGHGEHTFGLERADAAARAVRVAEAERIGAAQVAAAVGAGHVEDVAVGVEVVAEEDDVLLGVASGATGRRRRRAGRRGRCWRCCARSRTGACGRRCRCSGGGGCCCGCCRSCCCSCDRGGCIGIGGRRYGRIGEGGEWRIGGGRYRSKSKRGGYERRGCGCGGRRAGARRRARADSYSRNTFSFVFTHDKKNATTILLVAVVLMLMLMKEEETNGCLPRTS